MNSCLYSIIIIYFIVNNYAYAVCIDVYSFVISQMFFMISSAQPLQFTFNIFM